MMKILLKALRLTVVLCIFLSVTYILVLWVFAKVVGTNDVVTLHGKTVGATNIGLTFTSDKYFRARPSCAGNGYDASDSGGSNKGPTNTEYLKSVEARITVFLAHHPYLQRKDVPAEMVTASGSGLDPDITPQSAAVQVRRVASARGMNVQDVQKIVNETMEYPIFGLFGTEKVNVLKLNAALDEVKTK